VTRLGRCAEPIGDGYHDCELYDIYRADPTVFNYRYCFSSGHLAHDHAHCFSVVLPDHHGSRDRRMPVTISSLRPTLSLFPSPSVLAQYPVPSQTSVFTSLHLHLGCIVVVNRLCMYIVYLRLNPAFPSRSRIQQPDCTLGLAYETQVGLHNGRRGNGWDDKHV